MFLLSALLLETLGSNQQRTLHLQALSGSYSIKRTTSKLLMSHIKFLCKKIGVGSEITMRTCIALGRDWQAQIQVLEKWFAKPRGWKGEEKR